MVEFRKPAVYSKISYANKKCAAEAAHEKYIAPICCDTNSTSHKRVQKGACIFTEVKTHACVMTIEFVSHRYFSKCGMKMQHHIVVCFKCKSSRINRRELLHFCILRINRTNY